MNFSSTQTPDGATISLTGAFTFNDHHSFRAVLDILKTASGPRHVLDLSGIDFLDSAALGMLLIAQDLAQASSWALILRKPADRVAQLIELSALHTIFTIEP